MIHEAGQRMAIYAFNLCGMKPVAVLKTDLNGGSINAGRKYQVRLELRRQWSQPVLLPTRR